MYPTKIIANGREYKINTDYRVALSCFKAIEDDEINDSERALAIITLLLGKKVKYEDYEECLKKCAIYLRCGKEENPDISEIDMDYLQDETYIKTSIRQCYKENLNKVEYMHWWEYNELIEGLTEDTILSKIRQIRNFDLKDEPDEKRKNEWRKAKEMVALKKNKPQKQFTEEEIKNMEEFRKLTGS